MAKKKKECRPPDGGKRASEEKLTLREIRQLMSHDSYERGASGAIRSKRTLAVFK